MVKITGAKLAAFFLSFFASVVYCGLLFAYAEYFSILVDYFHSDYATFGFFGTGVAALSTFLGPLPTMSAEAFSYPVCIGVSGVVIFASFYISSYVENIYEFFFSYTVLFAVAAGFLLQLTQSLICDVFEPEDHNYLLGISTAGSGIGIAGYSCLAAYYTVNNDYMSWNELFRVYAISAVVVILLFALFAYVMIEKGVEHRHNVKADSLDAIEDGTESNSEPFLPSSASPSKPAVKLFGWARLFSGDYKTIALFVSHIFLFIMDVVVLKFSLIYATNNDDDGGSASDMYYFVPIAFGVGTIVMRTVLPMLTEGWSPGSVNKLVQVGLVTTTGVLIWLPYTSTIGVLITLGTYAGFSSSLYPLVVLRTADYLGRYQYSRNVGIQYFAVGIGGLSGGYIAGSIYDNTFEMSYVWMACCASFGFSLLLDEVLLPEYSLCKYLLCGATTTAAVTSKMNDSSVGKENDDDAVENPLLRSAGIQ